MHQAGVVGDNHVGHRITPPPTWSSVVRTAKIQRDARAAFPDSFPMSCSLRADDPDRSAFGGERGGEFAVIPRRPRLAGRTRRGAEADQARRPVEPMGAKQGESRSDRRDLQAVVAHATADLLAAWGGEVGKIRSTSLQRRVRPTGAHRV